MKFALTPKCPLFLPTPPPPGVSHQRTTGHSESHNRNRKSGNKKAKNASCSVHAATPLRQSRASLQFPPLSLYLNQKETLGFDHLVFPMSKHSWKTKWSSRCYISASLFSSHTKMPLFRWSGSLGTFS